ncbi:MAG: hypothetical protein HZB26_00820 [Candidatus Hydrogenedentes bacterium]|nr:hypothetical protein [Candidatus Hydrogenedentota bacterium]
MSDEPKPNDGSPESATDGAPTPAAPQAPAVTPAPLVETKHPAHAQPRSGRRLWVILLSLLALAIVVDAALIVFQAETGKLPERVVNGVWGLTAIILVAGAALLWRWHIQLQAKYRSNQVSEIMIYSYPKLVYVWPVIFLGFVFCWPIDHYHWMSNTVEAWIYVAVLSTVILTVSIDLNRIASLLWIAILVIVVLAVVIVKLKFGVTFLDRIGEWIAGLSPSYSVSSGLVLSIILSIFYVFMIIGARINDLWFISHNQFEHRTVLGKDDSLARGAKRVKASYPDILELVLLGSGTLTVYSAQGNTVLASIENIPWLFFRMGRIDRILEAFEVSGQGGSGILDDESAGQDRGEEVGGDHV